MGTGAAFLPFPSGGGIVCQTSDEPSRSNPSLYGIALVGAGPPFDHAFSENTEQSPHLLGHWGNRTTIGHDVVCRHFELELEDHRFHPAIFGDSHVGRLEELETVNLIY